MPPRKRLGQLLTELGVIDEHQLQSALGHQKQWGGKLGGILVQKNFCTEDQMIGALSQHLGMQRVKLSAATVDPRALKHVSRAIAEKLHVFPYEVSGTGRGEMVTIAMSDPTDLSAVDQLAFHSGKRVKPMLAGDSEIVQMIQTHYAGGDRPPTGPQKISPEAPAPASAAAPPPAPPAPPAPVAEGEESLAASRGVYRVAPPPAAAPGPAVSLPGPVRSAPYIPPPAQKPAETQTLDEIEPDVPEPAPASVELPPDEGSFDLEPVAAHVQDVELEGSEALPSATAEELAAPIESASIQHEALPGGETEVQPLEGLEPVNPGAAPLGDTWGAAPDAEVPAHWPEAAAGAELDGGERLPTAAILGAAEEGEAPQGFDETPPENVAGEPGAAPDWSSPASDPQHTAGEEPVPDWSQASPELEAPSGDAGAAPAWSAEPAGGEHPAGETAPAWSDAAAGTGAQSAEADATPGWSDAPAAPDAPSSFGEHSPAEWTEPAAAEAGAWQSDAPGVTGWESEPVAAPVPEGLHEATSDDAGAHLHHGEEGGAPAVPEEPVASGAWPDVAPDESAMAGVPSDQAADHAADATRPFALPADAPSEAAGHDQAEAPDAWGVTDDPLAGHEPPAEAASASPMPDEAGAEEDIPLDEDLDVEVPGSAGSPGPVQAVERAASLSRADLRTLSSIGVDPDDGAGALRLLAALVRLLHRRDLLDPAELADEVREASEAPGRPGS